MKLAEAFSTRHNAARRLGFLLLAVILVGVGWMSHAWYQVQFAAKKDRVVRQKGFRFTSPLLDVELPEGYSLTQEPIPFKYKIKTYVNFIKENGLISDASVYYRDLTDGPWFGINEKQEFDAASMMKVPVMIAWLKRIEKDPKVCQHVFRYDGSRDMTDSQFIKPAETLKPGAGYTVEDLLHYMLNYSDNNATKILYENLSSAEISDVLDSMDVTNNPHDGSNFISVHGYSGFFRILYNAAYLSREMSERALQLLTLQDFSQGIVAGVPDGVPVASKFGENTHSTDGEKKQLHEFGIVYHPRGPYIIGVMTEGDSFERQAEFIRTISAMIYAEVENGMTRNAKH